MVKEKTVKIIQANMNEPFWEMKHMNFMMAFSEFMEHHRIDIDETMIEEGERESFIDDGIDKTRSVLKIKDISLVVVIKAHKENQWLFQFEEVINTQTGKSDYQTKVNPSHIVNINGKECVLLITDIASSDIEVFAVPVDVAEALMIPEYNNEEISRDENLLSEIEEYRLKNYIVHNYD